MKEKPTETEKEWKAHGFNCRVLFVRQSHRCGYVGIPKGHIAYDKSDSDLPIDVHGGLTYSKIEEDGLNWFGFDCIHAGDKSASSLIPSFNAKDHFWTLEEVVKETEDMAKQFAELTLGQIIAYKIQYEPEWFTHNIKIMVE